jgi:hypothetical protein
MTRSVEELRRESERSRAQLAATVDRLKEQVSETAEDIRHKVSPQHIKSEVSDYVTHTTKGWVDGLKQQIMDNPMRAVAAGTAVAFPLLRLARGVPLPLLMIGAGLALTSKTVRDRAAEVSGPAMDKAGEVFEDMAGRARAMQGDLRDQLASALDQAASMADTAQDSTAGLAADLRARATQAADTIGEKLKSGVDAAKDSASAAKDAAGRAPQQARAIISDNAALIAGLGVAIGAIVAAALPETKVEAKAMGQASDGVKRAAAEAAQSGFGAAKDAAMSAADAATSRVAEAGLGEHASRMTRNLSDSLKTAADDVVGAAFDPSRNSNT